MVSNHHLYQHSSTGASNKRAREPDEFDACWDTRQDCLDLHTHTASWSSFGGGQVDLSCASIPRWSIRDFIIQDCLGEGNFGTVYKAQCHRYQQARPVDRTSSDPPIPVALKRFCKNRLFKAQKRGKRSDLLLERETSIHSRLSHENVVAFYGLMHTHNHISFVLELSPHGDLYAYQDTYLRGRGLEEKIPIVQSMVHQIAKALDYLQSLSIAHRDIKHENILVFTDPSLPSATRLKLCDFGWATDFLKNPYSRTLCGTSEFVAIEMLQRQDQHQHHATAPNFFTPTPGSATGARKRFRAYQPQFVDVWALGVLTYELLHHQNPFHVEDNPTSASSTTAKRDAIFDRIRAFRGFGHAVATATGASPMGALCTSFLNELMHPIPIHRASPKQVLRHDFLNVAQPSSRCMTPSPACSATASTPKNRLFCFRRSRQPDTRHVTLSPPATVPVTSWMKTPITTTAPHALVKQSWM